ncbi:MAG: hypothetical protein ACJ0P6_03750 [Flavobacteriaceae bacterium]
MKKIFYILFASTIICSCSSGSDSDSTTLNQDLVGSWYGTSVDLSDATYTEVDLDLDADGYGFVTFDYYDAFDNYESTNDYDILWESTDSTLTLHYYDLDVQEAAVDTEIHTYVFIDNDTLEITEDDGDVTIMYRY